MQPYELTSEAIFSWASDYASYDELETVAKGVYGMYVQRRKNEQPKSHVKARRYVKKKRR